MGEGVEDRTDLRKGGGHTSRPRKESNGRNGNPFKKQKAPPASSEAFVGGSEVFERSVRPRQVPEGKPEMYGKASRYAIPTA
jgi:hypothetical protein